MHNLCVTNISFQKCHILLLQQGFHEAILSTVLLALRWEVKLLELHLLFPLKFVRARWLLGRSALLNMESSCPSSGSSGELICVCKGRCASRLSAVVVWVVLVQTRRCWHSIPSSRSWGHSCGDKGPWSRCWASSPEQPPMCSDSSQAWCCLVFVYVCDRSTHWRFVVHFETGVWGKLHLAGKETVLTFVSSN